MRNRITSLSLILTLLLAPLSGALAAVCFCDDAPTDLAGMLPVSCCDAVQCCYEHEEADGAAALLAEVRQQVRADCKVALRQSVQRLPSPVAVVALEHDSIHCADPPRPEARELSLRQLWLI